MGSIFTFFSNALKSSATSPTSKGGMQKFFLSLLCILGGSAAAIWAPTTGGVNLWLAGTLIGVGAQGTLSGINAVKSADAPTTTNVATGDTSKVEVKP